jgi:hypothetical protein
MVFMDYSKLLSTPSWTVDNEKIVIEGDLAEEQYDITIKLYMHKISVILKEMVL